MYMCVCRERRQTERQRRRESVWDAYICVCLSCVSLVPQKSEEGIWSLGAGLIGSCRPLFIVAQSWTQILNKVSYPLSYLPSSVVWIFNMLLRLWKQTGNTYRKMKPVMDWWTLTNYILYDLFHDVYMWKTSTDFSFKLQLLQADFTE